MALEQDSQIAPWPAQDGQAVQFETADAPGASFFIDEQEWWNTARCTDTRRHEDWQTQRVRGIMGLGSEAIAGSSTDA